MRSTDTEATAYVMQRFVGPQCKSDHFYTADSDEFVAAAKALGWSAVHDTSTLYCPQTNGIAERASMRFKEGTRCALMQSGFHVEW